MADRNAPVSVLVPVFGPDGLVQLYDFFIDGVWFGSRRTVEHAEHMATQSIGHDKKKTRDGSRTKPGPNEVGVFNASITR